MGEESYLEAFLHGSFRDWLDTESRPLGEVSSRYYPPTTNEIRCPYSDSRKGLPINQSALLQLHQYWPAILATIQQLAGKAPTTAGLLNACTAAVLAPLSYSDRPVPAGISALYKSTIGVHQLLISLLLDSPGLASLPAAELPSGAAFFQAADQGHWLIGAQQACAGPARDIEQFWEVLTGRQAAPLAEKLPVVLNPWGEQALALVLALVLATQSLSQKGASDFTGALGPTLVRERGTSWILGGLARPDRPIASVLGLYQKAPPVVVACIENLEKSSSFVEQEQVFYTAIRSLSA
jgi:hypothetical protein